MPWVREPSRVDQQLWNSVQKTRLREPESFASLVELTLPRVFASRDADERLTLAAYQRIGPYLHQLRKGDDFWAWLEQLCGGKPEEEWSQETPPPELAEKARVVAASGEPCRFLKARRMLVGSVLSGFVPAFLAFSSLIFWSNGMNSHGAMSLNTVMLVAILLLGALMAAGFVVGVAPWVAGWRRSFLLGPPALMVPLSAGMFAATLPFLARPWLVMAGERLERAHVNPFLRPAMSLMTSDTFIAVGRGLKPVTFWPDNPQVPWWIYAFAFLSMAVGLCLCQVIVKRHPWVVQHRVPTWRKGLSLCVVLPALWQLLVVANIYLDGRRIDPSLRAYLAQEIPQKNWPKLPDAFEMYCKSDAYHQMEKARWGAREGLSPQEWEQVCDSWLKGGSAYWSRPDWSIHPAVARYQNQAFRAFYLAPQDAMVGPRAIEALVRSACMSDSIGYTVPWSRCQLSAPQWEALGIIVVESMEAPDSVANDIHSSFDDWSRRVDAGLNSSNSANRSQFELVHRRAKLNRYWRKFERHHERFGNPKPLSRSEYELLRSSLLWSRWGVDPSRSYFRAQLQHHERAQALIECEVRARLAAGDPPPASFADFSPRASKLLLPLESWLQYKVVGNSVELDYLTFDSAPARRLIKLSPVTGR